VETSANAASRSGKAAEELMIGDVAAMPGLNEESFGMSWERHFFSPNASASQERRRESRSRIRTAHLRMLVYRCSTREVVIARIPGCHQVSHT